MQCTRSIEDLINSDHSCLHIPILHRINLKRRLPVDSTAAMLSKSRQRFQCNCYRKYVEDILSHLTEKCTGSALFLNSHVHLLTMQASHGSATASEQETLAASLSLPCLQKSYLSNQPFCCKLKINAGFHKKYLCKIRHFLPPKAIADHYFFLPVSSICGLEKKVILLLVFLLKFNRTSYSINRPHELFNLFTFRF